MPPCPLFAHFSLMFCEKNQRSKGNSFLQRILVPKSRSPKSVSMKFLFSSHPSQGFWSNLNPHHSAATAVRRKNLRCLGWRTVNPGSTKKVGKVKFINQNCFGDAILFPWNLEKPSGRDVFLLCVFFCGDKELGQVLEFDGDPKFWVKQQTTTWFFGSCVRFSWHSNIDVPNKRSSILLDQKKTPKNGYLKNQTRKMEGEWTSMTQGVFLVLKMTPLTLFEGSGFRQRCIFCVAKMKQFWPQKGPPHWFPGISNISNLPENLPAMKWLEP